MALGEFSPCFIIGTWPPDVPKSGEAVDLPRARQNDDTADYFGGLEGNLNVVESHTKL
jgi:hypothetical protein